MSCGYILTAMTELFSKKISKKSFTKKIWEKLDKKFKQEDKNNT